MDIKTIAGIIGLVITIGGLFVFQGQLIQRVDVLEAKSAPDLKPLEQDIAINKAEIAVIKAKIEEINNVQSISMSDCDSHSFKSSSSEILYFFSNPLRPRP